jgi:hypothetical protein
MVPGLFKSRRAPSATDETAKVVDAVWAYYEAGRRPATTQISASAELPGALPGGEPELVSHQAANSPDEPAVTAGGQSLSELADELEALIESIRYGDVATPANAT